MKVPFRIEIMITTKTLDAYYSLLSAATCMPMPTRHVKMNVSARDSVVFLIFSFLHRGSGHIITVKCVPEDLVFQERRGPRVC